MKLNLIPTKEITNFENEIGVDLMVNERTPSKLSKYYVHFKDCEAVEGNVLVSYYGDGNTIDDALIDYCKKISCKRVAINSYTNSRKDINFPKLIHTKLLKK